MARQTQYTRWRFGLVWHGCFRFTEVCRLPLRSLPTSATRRAVMGAILGLPNSLVARRSGAPSVRTLQTRRIDRRQGRSRRRCRRDPLRSGENRTAFPRQANVPPTDRCCRRPASSLAMRRRSRRARRSRRFTRSPRQEHSLGRAKRGRTGAQPGLATRATQERYRDAAPAPPTAASPSGRAVS